MLKKKLVGVLAAALALILALGACGSPKAAPLSDTVKWMNTSYATLTAANEGNLNLIGGFKKSTVSKTIVMELLDSWWSVTDRATADETVASLLEEGHRAVYNSDLEYLKEEGLFELSDTDLAAELKNWEDPNLVGSMVAAYKKYGENAISAWDYCRILQLYGYYYVADLYTEQEALDASLAVAKELQTMYTSWDDLVQSYLYGYQYWQEDDASDPESATAVRIKVYNDLCASKQNPYVLDWNTPLTKTW